MKKRDVPLILRDALEAIGVDPTQNKSRKVAAVRRFFNRSMDDPAF